MIALGIAGELIGLVSNVIIFLRNKMKTNPKHKKFVKGLLEGKNQTEAALSAGYSPGSAESMGHRLMKRDNIRADLLTALEKVGITDMKAAIKMQEGLEAMTPARTKGGDRYEDFFVRKQYLDMYFRLVGAYAPEKVESVEKHIVINIDSEFLKGLKDAKVLSDDEMEVIEGEILQE